MRILQTYARARTQKVVPVKIHRLKELSSAVIPIVDRREERYGTDNDKDEAEASKRRRPKVLDSFSATFIKALRWYLLGLLCIGSHRRKAVGIVSALHSYDCSVDMINHLLD